MIRTYLRDVARSWLNGLGWAAVVVLVAFMPAYYAAYPPLLDGATEPAHHHAFTLTPVHHPSRALNSEEPADAGNAHRG